MTTQDAGAKAGRNGRFFEDFAVGNAAFELCEISVGQILIPAGGRGYVA